MTAPDAVTDAASDAPAPVEPSAAALMTDTAVTVFRLNARLLAFAEELARPVGLTAAWWQVLGEVLEEPLSVAAVARAMGTTRQSVRRVADLLVERGLAEFRPNPAHRRARLLAPTPAGRAAVDRITPQLAELAARFAETIGDTDRLAEILAAVGELSEAASRIAEAHPPER